MNAPDRFWPQQGHAAHVGTVHGLQLVHRLRLLKRRMADRATVHAGKAQRWSRTGIRLDFEACLSHGRLRWMSSGGTIFVEVPEWITYEQAAAILGCHFSNVAKLIRKGDLTSTGKRGASLNREQVEALAERRAAERAAKAARPPRKYQRVDHRPDHDHEWLSVRQVAELLGVTRPAVMGRIHRGKLPSVENGGRYWVRRDHLEQVEAARLVRKTRRPIGAPARGQRRIP